MARRLIRRLAVALVLTGLFSVAAPAAEPAAPAAPVKGMVTVVDLGAKTCVPCRMMAPVLSEVEREYKGRAAVVFIDVREHNEQAGRFRIRAIPTQIFFDKAGREVDRHEGFMDKKTLAARLDRLLAQ
jgi:thioredoxin 1